MKKPEDPGSSDELPQRETVSLKERARLIRRQAYQRAKAQRAADPRTLALKEAARQHRRAQYQQVKERRKAAAAEEQARDERERERQRLEERAHADQELAKLLRFAAPGSKLPN